MEINDRINCSILVNGNLEAVSLVQRLPTDLPEFPDLEFEQSDVIDPVAVLLFALAERALLDADLLIQEGQLVIAPHQLGAQDVPLRHDLAHVLPLLGPLRLSVGQHLHVHSHGPAGQGLQASFLVGT